MTDLTITLEYATKTINLRHLGVRIHQPKRNMKTSNQDSYDKRPSSSQLPIDNTLSNPNEELLRVHNKTSLSNILYKQPRHQVRYISNHTTIRGLPRRSNPGIRLHQQKRNMKTANKRSYNEWPLSRPTPIY